MIHRIILFIFKLHDQMVVRVLYWPLLLITTALISCSKVSTPPTATNALSEQELSAEPVESTKVESSIEFTEIDWDALIPEDDLAMLMTPPDYIRDIEDGSLQDSLEQQIGAAFNKSNDPYQQALVSTKVIDTMDNRWVKLPGFIVPIATNEQQKVTEFFLVPYFGACLHMPPPPPNQIIYASYPQGLNLPSLYDAFWLSGQLNTEVISNSVAKSAYSMRVAHIESYQQPANH